VFFSMAAWESWPLRYASFRLFYQNQLKFSESASVYPAGSMTYTAYGKVNSHKALCWIFQPAPVYSDMPVWSNTYGNSVLVRNDNSLIPSLAGP